MISDQIINEKINVQCSCIMKFWTFHVRKSSKRLGGGPTNETTNEKRMR